MITIGLEGDHVPALGFGTWQITGSECRHAVLDALEIGYRHIDTARIYGNEEEVGSAIASSGIPREQIFLTTKIWWRDLAYRDARVSALESLHRLGTDFVDLLLIHWPNPEIPLEEPLRALVELKDEGRARHIGVSNFDAALLTAALARAPVACIQAEYHPLTRQDDLLEIARRRGLLFTAYSPLARGQVRRDPLLKRIGERHGKSAGQVALRWLLQQERVAAIPKAARSEHRRENFAVFDFELSADEMEAITTLSHGRAGSEPAARQGQRR